MTLRSFYLITDALIDVKRHDLYRDRILNQELGVLIAHAFHAPQDMPNFVETAESDTAEMPEDIALAMLRAHFTSAANSS